MLPTHANRGFPQAHRFAHGSAKKGSPYGSRPFSLHMQQINSRFTCTPDLNLILRRWWIGPHVSTKKLHDFLTYSRFPPANTRVSAPHAAIRVRRVRTSRFTWSAEIFKDLRTVIHSWSAEILGFQTCVKFE
jgi:hypothetical protein